MTLNDIKREALHLMFTNYSEILGNVDNIENEEYTQYLANMNGCINRCLKRFESAGVLPLIRNEIEIEESDNWLLKIVLTGVKRIDRVIYENENNYISSVPYEIEGDKLVLPKRKGGKYIVLCHPKAAQIDYDDQLSSTDLSEAPYSIPEELCVLIPYFIKAELFEEDEPNLATQARNMFEAMLNEYLINNIQNSEQVSVENVFGEI